MICYAKSYDQKLNKLRGFSLNIARSTLIYDGECDFCVCSVGWLKRIIKDQVECLPFQSSLKRFPQIIVENCERSIHWIDVDGNGLM